MHVERGYSSQQSRNSLFPKGGIKGDHVLLITPAQITRLDKAQVEGRQVVYSPMVLVKRIWTMVRGEMDSSYTNKVDAIKCRNAKMMASCQCAGCS